MKKLSFLFIVSMIMISLSLSAQTTSTTSTANTTQRKFVIHTDFGDMHGVLYNDTPKHRDNFIKLVT